MCTHHENTQVTAFHLKNKEANQLLKVVWNYTKLENTAYRKYLGVTLDRSFTNSTYTTQNKGGYPQ